MAITTDDLKYRATMRYSTGWTDPRAVFANTTARRAPFLRAIDHQIIFDLERVSDETLRDMWALKFKDRAPTEDELSADPFYYAVAFRWWKQGRLIAHNNVVDLDIVFWPKNDTLDCIG